MLRRAAVIGAGLTMGMSFGLAGAGMASAAVPALKIQNGAIWTLEVNGGGCQQDKFNATTHHFKAVNPLFGGDKGTWTGGGSGNTLMTWTQGSDAGGHFGGGFQVGSSPKEYEGTFVNGDFIATAWLVKGAVTSFNGLPC
jgi:hypothetical protein